jgi:hypothetical protein
VTNRISRRAVRLPALVAALAAIDGRDEATLAHYARLLREAGHIRTTKRGRGAAAMNVRDAANLLLGTNSAEAPRDAVAALQRLRRLRADHTPSWAPWQAPLGPLAVAPTFGDAAELLVGRAPQIWAGMMQELSLYAEAGLRLRCVVRISRAFAAGIDAHGIAGDVQAPQTLAEVGLWRYRDHREGGGEGAARPRRTIVELDFEVFLALHAALFPDGATRA